MEQTAIRVTQVSKIYKLYDTHSDRLKDALGFSRKKNYREHQALKEINLEIKKGETIGIIGTNGSGKSTLLKIITGVIGPTSGEVEVKGRISALLELGAGFNMDAGHFKLCRYRRFCKSASQNLLQRNVYASGLCGGYQY